MTEPKPVGPHSMYTTLGMMKKIIAESELSACRQIEELLKRANNFPIVHSVSNGHKTVVLYISNQEEKEKILEAVKTRIEVLLQPQEE